MPKFAQPKIGLALGSGGAKGLAHIGVIKVLLENNIPIDLIAGSSIGAMVGGIYAATKDIKQLEKIAFDANWLQMSALIDPTWTNGILGGEKVKGFIEKHIGKINFNDCKIPFTAIATDLKTGEAVVMKKGALASAIRASISIPLVFTPIEREGRLLTDGGLSLPVPVEIARQMGADIVIAVDLDFDYSANGPNKNFNFYKIAVNSINLLRHHLAAKNVVGADVVINPLVGNFSWHQFVDGKKLIAIGETAAKKALPQLKKIINSKSKNGLGKYLDFFKI